MAQHGGLGDATHGPRSRHAWVDAAKGVCIILVVLFHSTLGVEKELGAITWMHAVIDWARPFRMPDFFLISGLFISAGIARPWGEFLDKKVVHFGYFYVLWFNIHFALRLMPMLAESGSAGAAYQYVLGYFDPFGSLWFIYLLGVYCIVVKLIKDMPVWPIMFAGCVAHIAGIETGSFILDEFLSRFVFFYAGYAFAPQILRAADAVKQSPRLLIWTGLVIWCVINTLGMVTGLASQPGADLIFAALGIAGVIAASVILTASMEGGGVATRWGRSAARAIMYFGQNSIVIYLSFTIFMAAARTLLIKLAPGGDGAWIALAASGAGLTGALVLHKLVQGTAFSFLFERPAMFRLRPRLSGQNGVTAVRA
jgi:uncharacterized membrane protein YcfT